MPDDACSDVKADIEAGAFTFYTTDTVKVYIRGKDIYQGGNSYIILDSSWRNPVQTVDGTVLYHKRGCQIIIRANSQEIRDAIYEDIEAILTATGRGYKLKRARDLHLNQNLNRTPFRVEMIL